MKLEQLINTLEVEKIVGNTDIEITGITQHSKRVKRGNIFICIKGFVFDGHKFIDEAIHNGAVAIITQDDPLINQKVTHIQVSDTRKAIAHLANHYYDYPTRKLPLIGITGTNGKTTTVYMLKSIFEEAGKKVGILTTVENIINNQIVPSKMTTMESLELQKAFSDMVNCGTDYAIMEVSSHSLSLSRVEGCDFDTAVFTNISDEHFEIHQNFENYLDSKKKLFQSLNISKHDHKKKAGIINIDEPFSKDILECLRTNIFTYGIKNKSMFSAKNIYVDLRKTHFLAETPVGKVHIHLNTSGLYNIYNALAAMAAAVNEGISLEIIAEAFRKFKGAPGRFKLIDYGQPFTIIVDFAHNFHGLDHILNTLDRFSRNRIITIFGHGGERDNRVRRKMGQVVGKYSDISIVTNDNPRSEDPRKIAQEIEIGLLDAGCENYSIILDRYDAIQYAMNIAEKNDIVLIAGKGPENDQVYQDRVFHHNDEEVVRKIIMEKVDEQKDVSTQ